MRALTVCELNMEDNFYFLKDKEGVKQLYTQAHLAERYFNTDPQSSLVKMRLFVELACHVLIKHLKLKKCPNMMGLEEKITHLEASGKVEHYIIDAMNRLRMEGNRSVHVAEVNGEYVASLKISTFMMNKHMTNMLDIARYIGEKYLNLAFNEFPLWKAPSQSCEFSNQVISALKGDASASLFLANHYFDELMTLTNGGESSSNKHFKSKQADLVYWLDKANEQQHPQSWLLSARCYANKFLLEEGVSKAKSFFKKAIQLDNTGEAAYEFGLYLRQHSEDKLGLSYIEKSAELGFHDALSFMLEKHIRGGDYQYWVTKALEHKLPSAFTCDAFIKMERCLESADELSKKALKTAITTAEAYRSTGIGFIKAYSKHHIFETMEAEEATKLMVNHHKELPQYLWYEYFLFMQISDETKHFDLMVNLFNRALYQVKDDEDKVAEMRFLLAQMALNAFKEKKCINVPETIPSLLSKAADAGHAEARKLLNSPDGRAILKCIGFNRGTVRQKNSAAKDKQKRLRKLAKKAKRK